MKNLIITIILLLLSIRIVSAQQYPETTDTIPSWIVYVDSVRMFSGAPEFDLRVEVAPGWVVRRKVFGFYEVEIFETYFNTEGVKFNSDIVLFTNRRKVVYNKFRQ